MQREQRFDRADRVVLAGLAATVVLTAVKVSAGYFDHSSAVLADGFESACDIVVSVGSLAALRISRHGWDKRHPYGHGRAESISALLVGLGILVTGAALLAFAAHLLAFPHVLRAPGLSAVAAAALTVGVKTVLARWTGRQGRQQESPALLALACDHRKDALTSIGTLVGAGGAALGWLALDPLAAAVTSVFILGMGWETLRGAAGDLMDSALPDGLLRGVTEIAGREPGVEHVHELRGRRSGQYVILDLKLEMDGAMTVKRSHDVAQSVKRRIFEAFPAVGDVMIHVNPHDDPDHEDLIRL